MSNIEINDKNDWILIVLLIAAAVWLAFGIYGCAPRLYQYKVTFDDGSVDYYELKYKVKNDSRVIEYNGETIFGVKEVELLK